MTVDINEFSSTLVCDTQGIWCAGQDVGPVSYPAGGHASCLAIEDGSFWFRHRNRCIVAAALRYQPANRGPVFDIGGGNGFVARGLEEAGYEVILVEPGPEGARNAKQRGLCHVVRATTQAAGFARGSMPAIGLFDVVEHIADDQSFLIEMRNLLVRDGRVFITVPAYQWLWSQEDVDAGHFRRYTLGSMSAVLHKSGFEIEFATSIFRPLPLPILLQRALPYRLGLRKMIDSASGANRDHVVRPGTSASLLDRVLASELANITAGRSMSIGGSLLMVAKPRGGPT